MQSMLLRLSVPGRDAHSGPRPHPAYGEQFNEEAIAGVAAEGRAVIDWEVVEIVRVGGERPEAGSEPVEPEYVELRRPRLSFRDLGYGPMGDFMVSLRVGPAMHGLGLLDAVSPATLAALAAEPKPDGVRGRVNHVYHLGRGEAATGRFGLKANVADLRTQIASAMLGDLGMSSSLFPEQNCTLVQTACRAAPDGGQPELSDAQLDDLEFYFAHLAVPARRTPDAPQVLQGEAEFGRSGCALCHRPSVRTGTHPRFVRLSDKEIAPYTDLLVHDMGHGLADDRPDFEAGGRDWRTPPLWGIGLLERVNGYRDGHNGLLHDGRARSFAEAILWHGGKAQAARDRYARLSRVERDALHAFLRSL